MNRMKLALVTAALLLALAAVSPQTVPNGEEPATTILLVRHAEKLADSGDPPLSGEGLARAAALARTLTDVGVTGLSATPYRRTQETLRPLAEMTGLTIEVRPVDMSSPQAYADALVAGLLEDYAGGTVVVAGHSNTVPLILAALGIAGPRSIGDDEYDDLFLVRVAPGKTASLLHLHYGEPSP